MRRPARPLSGGGQFGEALPGVARDPTASWHRPAGSARRPLDAAARRCLTAAAALPLPPLHANALVTRHLRPIDFVADFMGLLSKLKGVGKAGGAALAHTAWVWAGSQGGEG